MEQAGRARVFFALWPDSAARDTLAELAVAARAECGGRATASDKIHLTLFFIGAVARARIPELGRCARAVDTAPFELELNRLGYWRHNRIVWAGAERSPAALTALVADLSAKLAALGYPAEDRPYVPHVTLVRNARHAPQQTRLARVRWNADALALVESVNEGGAARYQVIAQWPFGAGAPRVGADASAETMHGIEGKA